MTLNTADLAKAKEAAINMYNDAVSHLYGEISDPTLADAVKVFLRYSEVNKKPDSYKHDEAISKIVLNYFGESKMLSALRPYMFDEFKLFLKETQGISGATVNRYLAFLSGVFTQAERNDQFSGKNPLKRVDRYKETSRKEYLPIALVHDILIHARKISSKVFRPQKSNRSQYYYYPYLLLICAGIRPAEIFRLRVTDIYKDHIIIPLDKTGESRTVAINQTMFEILSKLPKSSTEGLLFDLSGRKNPNADAFRHWWNKVTRAHFNLPTQFVPYTLRHSFCTNLNKLGVNNRFIQIGAGHHSITTTINNYDHTEKDAAHDAIRIYLDQITG
jgi:integrase